MAQNRKRGIKQWLSTKKKKQTLGVYFIAIPIGTVSVSKRKNEDLKQSEKHRLGSESSSIKWAEISI